MKEIDTNIENDNIISTSSKDDEIIRKKSTEEIEEVDQDKVQVIFQEIKAEFTSVASVLSPSEEILREKDLFDIIKFTIKVKAVHNYEWYVYRKPSDIKKNFEEISQELDKNHIVLSGNFGDMFNTVGTWTEDGIQIHISEIETYYKNLFKNPQVYNTLTFKEFFNISTGSFNQYNEGVKPFEGYVYKKADPQCLRKAFSIACYCIEYFAFAQYNLRWMIVKEDCIYYMDKSNSEAGKHIYFFDRGFKARKVDRDTINITNDQRSLILKFKTLFEREIWYSEIMKRANRIMDLLNNNPYHSYAFMKPSNTAKWFSDGQDYFADLAEKLLDAKESIFMTDWWMSPEVWLKRPVPMNTYMSMAYQQKKVKETDPSRLMDILYSCANRGVKIYIQVYGENSIALSLNSAHTQSTLTSLHPNIKVERHPFNHLLLWSHHEKLVIIDQIIAYVGGLDLCWGRYDTHDHPIYEPVSKDENNPQYSFPGIDYSNARIRDFEKVGNYLQESAIRSKEARMPWHDVHCRVIGPVAVDIAKHFVERWDFVKFGTGEGITDIKQSNSGSKELQKNGTISDGSTAKNIFGKWLMPIINKNLNKEDGKKDIIEIPTEALIPDDEKKDEEKIDEDKKDSTDEEIINTKDEEKEEEKDNDDDEFLNTEGKSLKGPTKLRGKKKILRTKVKKTQIDKELEEKEKKYQEMREAYMENKLYVNEDCLYIIADENKLRGRNRRNIKNVRDYRALLGQNLINANINNNTNNNNQLNKITNEVEKEEDQDTLIDVKEVAAPSFYDKFVKNIVEHSKKKEDGWFSQLFEHQEEEQKLENNIVNVNFFQRGIKSTVQVLRSASQWSVGIKQKEDSILQGYIKLIRESQNYIYIENQFFVSRPFDEDEKKKCSALPDIVENTIAYEIRKRIEKAYDEGKKFKVMVFIPLLPGFAGEPEESGTLQLILKYTYGAICRNHGYSIIEKLKEKMGDEWVNYIGFYSLRGHALINGVPTTEIIYIHSKLMIVDDKYVIIGSANINDRSMLGKRDSEFCVVIHEKEKYKSIMDGKEIKVAQFAQSFRVNLLAEHMGLDVKDNVLIDPLNDDFWKNLNERAKNNTAIYRKLWKCYPDDEFKTFDSLKNNDKPKGEELNKLYDEEKGNIKGHVVEFPLLFLEKEVLGMPFFSKENFIPEYSYT